MDLMEYKARELFERYEIPVMKGIVADDMESLDEKVGCMKFPVVVKAQVQAGGRGRAGGVKIADNPAKMADVSKSILGMNIKGHVVKKLLVVEKADIVEEMYLGIILDRRIKSPMIIFSPLGGVDIEETAKVFPEKVLKLSVDPVVGVMDYTARYLISKNNLDMSLFGQLSEIVGKLYRMFCECDCMLVEINPLAISTENRLIALDGKVSIDDSALGRQPDILAYRDSIPEDRLVAEARKYGFLYIPCDDEGDIGVMSNGSGMIMSCMDLIAKQGMKAGAALDLGGGATSDRIKEAVRIVLSNEKIKALFINIFGGITRCDEVASGVKLAVESQSDRKLVIVRFEGTNKDRGTGILKETKGNVVYVGSLPEGIRELSERRDKCEHFSG